MALPGNSIFRPQPPKPNPNAVVQQHQPYMTPQARVARSTNLIPPPQTGLLKSGNPTVPVTTLPVTAPIIRQSRTMPINPAAAHPLPSPTSGKSKADPNVIATQKALNAAGYHVKVDGIAGPETNAASADYAAKHGTVHNPARSTPTPNNQVDTGKGQIRTLVNPPGRTTAAPTKTKPNPKATATQTAKAQVKAALVQMGQLPKYQPIALPQDTSTAQANAEVAAKYTPIEGDINAQQTNATNAGVNDLARLNAAYGSALDTATGEQATLNQSLDQTVAGAQDASRSIGSNLAMSPELAAALASQGIAGSQQVAQQVATAKTAAAQGVGNLSEAQRFALNQSDAATKAALAGIQGQRTQMASNKGADLAAAMAQHKDDYNKEVLAIKQANQSGVLSYAQARAQIMDANRRYTLAVNQSAMAAKNQGTSYKEFMARLGFEKSQFATQTQQRNRAMTDQEIQQNFTNQLTREGVGAAKNKAVGAAVQGAVSQIVRTGVDPKTGAATQLPPTHLNQAYGTADKILKAAGYKPGSTIYNQAMAVIMREAGIKTGPKGRPVGLLPK